MRGLSRLLVVTDLDTKMVLLVIVWDKFGGKGGNHEGVGVFSYLWAVFRGMVGRYSLRFAWVVAWGLRAS